MDMGWGSLTLDSMMLMPSILYNLAFLIGIIIILCIYWASKRHPERKGRYILYIIIVGLLVLTTDELIAAWWYAR